MPIEIIIATVLFTLALILYSIAIWNERLTRVLKPWHLQVFFFGVLADALGVWITYKAVGAIVFTPHAILGFSALALMTINFLWVLIIFIRNKQGQQRFHQFGLSVWSIWIISYLSGFATGIQKIL
ncbi:MAG: TIGR03987 family protein [Gammaproteobacteria bacterium]|nr:MAG: TIGR03987 family protein [Gammaproteobacteria bacterium]